jgi:hypothetical protein
MDTWPDSTQESWPESANPPHAGARVPPHPIREPLPTVEVSAVFDEAKSDLETGLEVWVDPTTGKQHHRVDGLWDAACAIWGIPETDPEKDRRNREIKQLRKARVRPDQLQPLVEKAVVRWRGEARPGLAGIIRNLGDLRGGFDIDKRSVDEFQENARRDARAQLAADMTAQKGLPA